jgi:hypothetical protein
MPRFNLRPRPGSAGLGSSLRPCTYLSLGLLVAFGFILAWETRSGRSVVSLVNNRADKELQAAIDVILNSNASEPVDEDPASTALVDEESGLETAMAQDTQQMSSDADELKLWKLTHSMMYWAHSNPVPK